MTSQDVDLADPRARMVDGQLRPNRVTDERILAAMRALPRERFLPAAQQAWAYADEDVALPGGRCLMEPLVLARLVQLADPRSGERVLVVGAGGGYGAAVIAACGAAVVALEEDAALAGLARGLLPGLANDVRVVTGPLSAGWPGGAPYDVIFIEGGFEALPPAFAAQLRPAGGRLVGVRIGPGGIGQGVRGERLGSGDSVALRPAFDCATPVLPSLRQAAGFRF